MNVLFGDTFYHNIIYHLSMRDLYMLKCVCSQLNNYISKNFIKNITLRNIRDELKNVCNENYGKLKNKLKNATYSELHYTDKHNMLTDYNKYFVIIIMDCECENFMVYKHNALQLTIPPQCFEALGDYYRVSSRNNNILYCDAIKSDIDIENIKKAVYNYKNDRQKYYWIEHDSSELFNLSDYL
jgi:hypothetical protein